MILDDLIWLESIVEKLAWKHNIVPIEVEEVLQGECRKALIVTARDMTSQERRRYGKK